MVKSKDKELKKKQKLRDARRTNAKLFPIYKMFSWDLLFFYSIEFLFLTITKRLDASEILLINGFFLVARLFCQFPSVIISELIGRRKSIILGNFLLILFVLSLIFLPGITSILIADLFFALGYDLKTISETNLLYDSVSTRGGEGLFSKLDAKGGSWYYILDGIASLTAGYLFVINNYLPLIICLAFIIISTVISFNFKDIYVGQKEKKKDFKRSR